ncbi:MAG: tetratricopeptide repeat protein [Vicinamibacteria bacterium]|nr:tetratricopeptide repeat protein [Vicinamibacteria bacterium]
MSRKVRLRSLALALAVAGSAPLCLAQASPEEQARGLLEDGRAYRQQGKNKQALDNFNTIATGFQATSSVDDAILEIGRFYLEVERDFEKARAAFDQVAKQYPQSDAAPGAYYYLGLLALERATGSAEIDDAMAQFNRVSRLYPKSDWVPRALRASAEAQRRIGALQDAAFLARRVALEYPASDAAPEAQYLVGHCLALQGEARRAIEEFQQVRNRFPESPAAAAALLRTTSLWRLHGAGRAVFTVDAAWTVGGGELLKDVAGLAVAHDGTLWIASGKTKSVVPFDAQGKMGPSLPGPDVQSLSFAADGDLVIAGKLGLRLGPRDVKTFAVPGNKPGEMKPLEEVRAGLRLADGSLLVADAGRKGMHRFDAAGAYKGVFGDAKEREVTRLALSTEREVVALSKNLKAIEVFDDRGKLLRTYGPRGGGYELRKPADVAIDPYGNLYVADEELGVLVLSRAGQLLATLSGEELKRPQAVALDPSGAILVYDARGQRVVRFK